MPSLPDIDKAHFWHPFTQMQDWCADDHEPLVIASGAGAVLRDTAGREYLDGNASIWTNIHGHNHPAINAAIRDQLDRIAHCSALGTTNEPAIRLTEKLASLFKDTEPSLTKVFFTDDGSTAIECAVRMALEYWQHRGHPERREFVAFDQAYHGDTLGAASLGGLAAFHGRIGGLGLPVHRVADGAALASLDAGACSRLAAVVIEPLIQGAAGMKTWPPGMLAELRAWCDRHSVLLILDEVMTGFGRTGTMFACQRENITPDFLCLAKGLSGGYLPLAATLTTDEIFSAFLGGPERAFSYGHSYCGNPLGCAAALASLDLFETENTLAQLQPKIALLTRLFDDLASSQPRVTAVRQCGFIAGIDIAGPPGAGAAVCLAARAHGLLTRPVRNTVVLMPPLCITETQLRQAVAALGTALTETDTIS